MTQANSPFLGFANFAMAATPLLAVVMTAIQYLAR
jgi:hypothetical protein